MSLSELQERLDFLFQELKNHNISLDDVKEEIEDELKEFMSPHIYKRYVKLLENKEEEIFDEHWGLMKL